MQRNVTARSGDNTEPEMVANDPWAEEFKNK